MTTLSQRHVLITGAGHGLGLELAKAFAQQGAHIIITDVDQERVDHAVKEIESLGQRASGYPMDVTTPDDIRNVREQILSDHGAIHVLVNNAGIVSGGSFLEVPLERHRLTYDVNSQGPVNVIHVFLPDLISQDEAHIVNIISASSMIPLPMGTTYASSKWALLGFTESLREELRETGQRHVHVTGICPSYIRTGMFDGVKPPLLSTWLEAPWLAKKVVHSVQRNQEQVLAPASVHLIPLAKATWPRFLFRWFLNRMGVSTSMSNWKGHADTAQPTAPTEEQSA